MKNNSELPSFILGLSWMHKAPIVENKNKLFSNVGESFNSAAGITSYGNIPSNKIYCIC